MMALKMANATQGRWARAAPVTRPVRSRRGLLCHSMSLGPRQYRHAEHEKHEGFAAARGADELHGRMLLAGAWALARDFSAAVGVATVALGAAASAGWCPGWLHDRLLVAAADGAIAWAVWRGAALNAAILARRPPAGGGGSGDAARVHAAADADADADAGAALAALEWGASGRFLAGVVDARVCHLRLELLHREATVLRLARGGGGGDGSGSGGGSGSMRG